MEKVEKVPRYQIVCEKGCNFSCLAISQYLHIAEGIKNSHKNQFPSHEVDIWDSEDTNAK